MAALAVLLALVLYSPSAISVRRAASAASRFPSFLLFDTTEGNWRLPTTTAIVNLGEQKIVVIEF